MDNKNELYIFVFVIVTINIKLKIPEFKKNNKKANERYLGLMW